MNTFLVKDGQFWLDDQPLFIQAGEFHYFRTPRDQWAQRLDLLRMAGFNAVAAYIPWLWHQPEPGLSDLDGHTHPMRDLAGFLDLAASMGFTIIARHGPPAQRLVQRRGPCDQGGEDGRQGHHQHAQPRADQ